MKKNTTPHQSQAFIPAGIDEPILLESNSSSKVETMHLNYPENAKIGYAIVGLGHLTLNQILPAMKECKKSKISALVSGSLEKLRKTGEMYDIPESAQYLYEEFEQISENKNIDAVFIVLPNSKHKEFTLRSAKAKKHVLCEKPMTINSQECQEMIDACKAAAVKLMIAYRIQYEPYNHYVRQEIEEHSIGTVKFIQTHNGQPSHQPEHWRYIKDLAGGGALFDIGIYCLNTMRFLLDSEPLEVYAHQYSNPLDPSFQEIEEMVNWQMKFPDDIIVQCSTSYQIHTSRKYEIYGDGGWMILDDAYSYEGQKLIISKPEENLLKKEIKISPVNQFTQEIDYFSECILNDTEPYTSGEVGLQDLMIMEAIYESAQTNEPISLSHRLPKSIKRGNKPEIKLQEK